MELDPVPIHEALTQCAWCRGAIRQGRPVLTIGAKLRDGINMTEHEGTAISLTVSEDNRPVIAIIPSANSEARDHGYELMFMLCGEACAWKMNAAIEGEIALGDYIVKKILRM